MPTKRRKRRKSAPRRRPKPGKKRNRPRLEQIEIFSEAEVGVRFVPSSKGYAAPPATGPRGETCSSCAHYCRLHLKTTFGNFRTWRKCGLRRDSWTHGDATEIRAGAPACSKWRWKIPPGSAVICNRCKTVRPADVASCFVCGERHASRAGPLYSSAIGTTQYGPAVGREWGWTFNADRNDRRRRRSPRRLNKCQLQDGEQC